MLPPSLQEPADVRSGALLLGRLVRVVGGGERVEVAVTADGEVCVLEAAALLRPPTQEEVVEVQREAREAREREREAQEGERPHHEAPPEHPLRPPAATAPAPSAPAPAPAAPPPPPPASPPTRPPSAPAKPALLPQVEPPTAAETADAVRREEYRPAAGFVASEQAARAALADRLKARRAAAPPQREYPGMDEVLERLEAIDLDDDGAGGLVPVSSVPEEGVTVAAGVKATPGYNLVRVGNFTERVDRAGHASVADIAFFHHYPTLHQIYDEHTYHRQRLVRECCGALRDVCDECFGYDAAKVTLFYEPGAGSRFVRQKMLFNIWPVEQRKAAIEQRDVRTDSFVYAYFYGLAVHKLAHLWDVVHGTRHDFYMSEYRANYDLQWTQLLLKRGFEPEQVERDHRKLLWQVVD